MIQSAKGEPPAQQLQTAIDQLRSWHLTYPQELRIVCDLAALLDKAGDYASAALYYQQIMQADAPAYAINAVAHAVLKTRRYAEAEAAYQLLITRTPNDIDAHVGLVYAWMGQQRIQAAFDYALRHLPPRIEKYTAADIPMMIALAELHEVRYEWLQAALVYQKVLQFDPDFRYAQRGRVFALSRADLPYLAERYAERHADLFNAEEKYQLAHAADALTIRFGEAQLSAEDKRARVTTIDIALAENTDATRQFGEIVGTQFDRMIALRDRGRMREVVQLYRSLVDAKVALPSYVKLAAADAYLFLEQPETARDLYLDALKDTGAVDKNELLGSQISLVYAYNDAEQFKEAEALAEQLLRNQPKLIYQGLRGLEAPNPDYSHVSALAVLLQMVGERLAIAEKRLRALKDDAPFNPEVRAAWASLQSSREHPRAALEEFSLLQIDQPTSVDAAVGRGETLLSLNEYAKAKTLLPPLQADNAESKAVQNYARKLANYGSPLYKIETTRGRGTTGNGADSVTDTALYSAPLSGSLGDPFRVFTHLTRADGETNNQNASRSRIGVGLDYRVRDISVEGEVTQTLGDTNASGVALELSWDLSDAWHVQAAVDTNVNDLPAAALRDGVKAEGIKLGMTWILNESRKAGGELSQTRFSDGNLRGASRVWWQERWVSGPTFKLDTVLGLSNSANSQSGRNYFNPSSDTELDLETRMEWLSWRRYQRSFKQRFAFSFGQYSQSGFGQGGTAGLRYEHEWHQDDDWELRYGAGRSFHPYDGHRDYRSYVFLNLSGRIK